MASKCGCAGNSCSCKVIAGRGAKVHGTGAQNNLIVIDALPMSLAVSPTGTVLMSLTGNGSQSSPWILEANVSTAILDETWNVWVGTQSQYNALGTYDQQTLYGITGP